MSNWHVVPLGDLKEHDESPNCACGPFESDDGVWVHNAYDGREKYETGERKPH